MNKILASLFLLIIIASCKGPGSGPLVREAFKNNDQAKNSPMEGKSHMGQVASEKINVVVEPCDGCITIAKLLENKQLYSGKVIKVKGQVTKFNPEIMGKNWIHIQDGTEYQTGFDLTVTTDIQVAVGAVVTFEGKIALDKDFGYGYVYNVLMEEGKLVK
jgi:hypothetical protein